MWPLATGKQSRENINRRKTKLKLESSTPYRIGRGSGRRAKKLLTQTYADVTKSGDYTSWSMIMVPNRKGPKVDGSNQ